MGTYSMMQLTAKLLLACMQYFWTFASSTMLQFLVMYQGAPLLVR